MMYCTLPAYVWPIGAIYQGPPAPLAQWGVFQLGASVLQGAAAYRWMDLRDSGVMPGPLRLGRSGQEAVLFVRGTPLQAPLEGQHSAR